MWFHVFISSYCTWYIYSLYMYTHINIIVLCIHICIQDSKVCIQIVWISCGRPLGHRIYTVHINIRMHNSNINVYIINIHIFTNIFHLADHLDVKAIEWLEKVEFLKKSMKFSTRQLHNVFISKLYQGADVWEFLTIQTHTHTHIHAHTHTHRNILTNPPACCWLRTAEFASWLIYI